MEEDKPVYKEGFIEKKWNEFMLDDNRHWMINFALSSFDKMIPESGWVRDFRDMPSLPMYFAAAFFNILWWGVFAFFLVQGYISARTQSFVSLQKNAGQCNEVPFAISGTYLIDSSGHWESFKRYTDATALYQAEFLGYASTVEVFTEFFQSNITEKLQRVGEITKYRDLAYNMIAWSTWSYADGEFGKFVFKPMGEISVILDKYYVYGGMALNASQYSEFGMDTCLNGAGNFIQFDRAASTLTFGYDVGPGSGVSPECQYMADVLGYDEFRQHNVFSTWFNLNSFATAVAVNFNIVNVTQFVKITDSVSRGYLVETDDGFGSGFGDDEPWTAPSDDFSSYPIYFDDFFFSYFYGSFYSFYFGDDDYFGDDFFGDDTFGDDTFGDDTFGDDTFGDDAFGDDTFGDDAFADDTFGDDTFGDDTFADDTVGDDTVGDDYPGDDLYADDYSGTNVPAVHRAASNRHDHSSEDRHHRLNNPYEQQHSQVPVGRVRRDTRTARTSDYAYRHGDITPHRNRNHHRNQNENQIQGSPTGRTSGRAAEKEPHGRNLVSRSQKQAMLAANVEAVHMHMAKDVEDASFSVSAGSSSQSTYGIHKPSSWQRYYDPKYSSMEPIFCITFNSSSLASCFLQLYVDPTDSSTAVYAYPVMKHFEGTDCYDEEKFPSSWYDGDPTTNGNWSHTMDHSFDFLLGLLVFPKASGATSFAYKSFLSRNNVDNGDLAIADAVHVQMRAVMDGTGTYNMSSICGNTCFLMTFNSYGPGYYINEHNYQMFAGACRDSIFSNTSIFYAGRNPPEPLVQVYYNCTLGIYDSFFQALGLSTGNADVYAAWAFYGAMAVFVYFLYLTRGFDSGMFHFQSIAQEQAAMEKRGMAGGFGIIQRPSGSNRRRHRRRRRRLIPWGLCNFGGRNYNDDGDDVSIEMGGDQINNANNGGGSWWGGNLAARVQPMNDINDTPNMEALDKAIAGGEGVSAGTLMYGTPYAGVPTNSLPVNASPMRMNGMPMNGMSMNGMPMNGMPMNGMPMNGMPMNGMPMNGMPMNGMPMNGMPMNGMPMNGMPMNGMPGAPAVGGTPGNV